MPNMSSSLMIKGSVFIGLDSAAFFNDKPINETHLLTK